MKDASIASRTRAAGSPGLLVILLATAIFIHALDRGNLATAAPLIQTELKLSNAQLGMLLSAFFWVYVPGHLLAGWVIERINAYRTLALGLAIWSLATFLTGLTNSFAMLLVLRLLLGLGESSGFPASSKLLALHIPQERLGIANAFISAGLMVGNGAGTLLGGLLIARLGWRALFLVFGAVSLSWLLPWTIVSRHGEVAAVQPTSANGPGYAEILSKRELWGASIGHFAVNYPYFMLLSWLPLYLVRAHGYSITAMALLGGAVYALSAIFGFVAGGLADGWIRRGASVNVVRKSMMYAGTILSLACMIACAIGSPQIAIASLVVYSLAIGLTSFNMFAIGQTLAGPDAAGKWIGIQNAVGGISGIVGPIITGVLVDWTGSFRPAFLVSAAVVCVGIVCWGVVIRRVAPLTWAVPVDLVQTIA